ncbi:hypothetical protein G6O67_001959 [Ophiocordyceps sinensis]|uniref:Uncharacterized protein n=1 Tax=Ophiocordyceps sinensis TaxID=72228 RepID=A0A8H4V6Q2_9HYPO|nr:hypothetical protein G6O67_001959 [Ophiocordyceps sinensis]
MGRLFRTAVLVWRREEEGDENKGLGGEKAKDWLGRKAEFYIENRGSEYRGRTCREMDARCPPASSEIQSLCVTLFVLHVKLDQGNKNLGRKEDIQPPLWESYRPKG